MFVVPGMLLGVDVEIPKSIPLLDVPLSVAFPKSIEFTLLVVIWFKSIVANFGSIFPLTRAEVIWLLFKPDIWEGSKFPLFTEFIDCAIFSPA
jgi:hypothetical protein